MYCNVKNNTHNTHIYAANGNSILDLALQGINTQ